MCPEDAAVLVGDDFCPATIYLLWLSFGLTGLPELHK